MPGLRELLAIVLGVGLGLALIAAPRAAMKLSVFVGPSRRRRGEYGTESVVPGELTWVVRGLGVLCLLVAGYIAFQAGF
jgi:hypothetical protein